MERRTKVEDELNLCGVKIVNLGKALDKLQSQASDLVIFSLQWRDLEDHLMSVKGNVEKMFIELQRRSFEIDERAKVLEAGEGRVGELEVKADGFKREIEVKEEELSGLSMLVEECSVKRRLKASEIDEMVEAGERRVYDLEMKADGFRREIEVKEEELRGLRMLVEECTVKQRLKASEIDEMVETLRKTQDELDMKGGELAKMEAELERHRVEVSSEMGRRRELDEEIERKTRDLTLVQDKVAECGKLLETRSLELAKTQGELDLKVEQLGHVKIEFATEMENLERIQTRNRELEEDIDRKRKDLSAVLDRTAEREKQLEVVEEQLDYKQKLLETRSLELVSKEKELQELSLDLDLREQMVKSLNNEMEETCQKMESKAKELEAIESLIDERTGHCESIKLLIKENTEELAFKEKRHDEITEATRKLSVEIAFKENKLTDRNKQVEEGEKKIQDLNNTNEELNRQVKVRQEQVSSIQEAIRECTCELEAKRKDCDQVQSSITDLTVELISVEKKIQESLEELQSTEEQQVRLKASLMEHEQGLELREKELIAREERINEQYQKVQLTKQELAKWVEDCEMKAKQLSNFCLDEHVALTPGDIHNPTGNSRKRGRYDDKSLTQSRDEGLDGATKTLDHVLTSCTNGQENTYNFENQRSPDKFQIDQIWAIYSDSDKGMPIKYAQIKKIDTSPEFKLHVAPLVLYRPPPPNLLTHPVCCGRFKLKIGKAEVLVPSSFSHKVKAVKSSVNRFEVYPGKGEIWALYKNCAETEEKLEIVEIVETDEQSIQAMFLTADVFNKLLYGRCLESKAGVVDIPKNEVNRFSHQIPAFRRDRRATRSGDCEWWELDSKAVLVLNSKKP